MNHYFRISFNVIGIFSFFITASLSLGAYKAEFGLGPDNNQKLLVSTIRSAKKTLVINIYQLDHPTIVDAIIERIASGTSTLILLEGEPVGKISSDGKKAIESIQTAMIQSGNQKNHLYIMKKPQDSIQKRRFRFNHAKYVVSDSQKVLISSENFTHGGHADPGEIGNRGWDVLIEDPKLAQKLLHVFSEDSDLSYGDVTEQLTDPSYFNLSPQPVSILSHRNQEAIPSKTGIIENYKLISSPDSLDDLLALIQSAQSSLDIEEMSLPLIWRLDGQKQDSRLVDALVNAAQRGVKVRVLLNDERAFGGQGFLSPLITAGLRGNALTASHINQIAEEQQIPIVAKLVDTRKVGISYIHNKGMLIDKRGALISSVNGTQTSLLLNREIALYIESQDALKYYTRAFDFDWKNSPSFNSRESLNLSSPTAFSNLFNEVMNRIQ